MEEQKTLEELKLQLMQQHGVTEEQLDNMCKALVKVCEAIKKVHGRNNGILSGAR